MWMVSATGNHERHSRKYFWKKQDHGTPQERNTHAFVLDGATQSVMLELENTETNCEVMIQAIEFYASPRALLLLFHACHKVGLHIGSALYTQYVVK